MPVHGPSVVVPCAPRGSPPGNPGPNGLLMNDNGLTLSRNCDMMAPLDSTGNWERTLNPGLQARGVRGGIDVRPVAEEPAEPLLARRYGYAAAFDEIGGHDG